MPWSTRLSAAFTLIFLLTLAFRPGPAAADSLAEKKFEGGALLRLIPLRTGHRPTPRCMLAAEASCFSFVDMVHTAFLVEHASGTRFLIDAGLGREARRDLLRFGALQRAALDYQSDLALGNWLGRLGNPPIAFVLLTHLHWDHTSGLGDMQKPLVLMAPEEKDLLEALRPDDFTTGMRHHFAEARVEAIAWNGEPWGEFEHSHDVFGDGSVILLPLPGHTHGSTGVLLNHVEGRRLLFIGDATWSLDGVRLPSHRPAAARELVDMDDEAMERTLGRLHRLANSDRELIIVPAHDGDMFEKLDRWVRTGTFPRKK